MADTYKQTRINRRVWERVGGTGGVVGLVILIVVGGGRHGRTGGKHQERGTAERRQEP
jgi:hypothetical protein